MKKFHEHPRTSPQFIETPKEEMLIAISFSIIEIFSFILPSATYRVWDRAQHVHFSTEQREKRKIKYTTIKSHKKEPFIHCNGQSPGNFLL